MFSSPKTSWLKSPYHTRGLDPLGAQAPAINIYGQLLPGITNVTDRARYYSFYPWMIRAFELNSSEKTYEALREWVRRSDCLFSMIGIRHGLASEGKDQSLHTRALIGSNTLTSVVQRLDDESEVDFSVYAQIEDSPHRYFKNHLGGLRQYYIGTFDGLGLMIRKGQGVANTNEIGVPMAEAMDSYVESELFIKTVSSGKVSRQVLDDLVSFCPCQLMASNDEHRTLQDLFFARNSFDNELGQQRRNTLGLILNLIRETDEHGSQDAIFDQNTFRSSVYTGALSDGSSWSLPESLEFTRSQWSVYQKHELLSSAIQSIFWVALRMIEESADPLWSTEDFINWFSTHNVVKQAASSIGADGFAAAQKYAANSLPSIQDWLDENHEMQLVQVALAGCNENNAGDYSVILQNAGLVLLALLARDDLEKEAYSPLHFSNDFFLLYPLNLKSLRQKVASEWETMSTASWLAWVAGHWGIEAHFRVALRKLRFQNKDTLHILPTDYGLVVQELPSPTYTTPRFSQGIQILEDLGAITKNESSHTILTSLGQALREETHV